MLVKFFNPFSQIVRSSATSRRHITRHPSALATNIFWQVANIFWQVAIVVYLV